MSKLIAFQFFAFIFMMGMPIEPPEHKEIIPALFSIYFGIVLSLLFADFLIRHVVAAFKPAQEK